MPYLLIYLPLSFQTPHFFLEGSLLSNYFVFISGRLLHFGNLTLEVFTFWIVLITFFTFIHKQVFGASYWFHWLLPLSDIGRLLKSDLWLYSWHIRLNGGPEVCILLNKWADVERLLELKARFRSGLRAWFGPLMLLRRLRWIYFQIDDTVKILFIHTFPRAFPWHDIWLVSRWFDLCLQFSFEILNLKLKTGKLVL